MAECPQCGRFSLDFDPRLKRARCLYVGCFAGELGSVPDRDAFYAQYGHGERLVGEAAAINERTVLL